MKKIGVYIHIPFCKQKCYYCDFISYANNEKYFEKYVQALIKEINNFLYNNVLLKSISLDKVEIVGHNFIWLNKVLENLSLPNLKVVGDNFLYSNETLDSIDLPNLVSKGFSFIFFNDKIKNKVLRK